MSFESWPSGGLRLRIVASTAVPSARAISCTLARAPNVIRREQLSMTHWVTDSLADGATLAAMADTSSMAEATRRARSRTHCLACELDIIGVRSL